MPRDLVAVPGLLLFAGIFAIAGLLLSATRYLSGLAVLNDWRFMMVTGLVSIAPAVVILIYLFSRKSFLDSRWRDKWLASILIAVQIFLGTAMICNGLAHVANRYCAVGDSFTADALVLARSNIGYKRFFPTVTLFADLELGEKITPTEIWRQIEGGAIISIRLQRSCFGFTNILRIKY